MELRQIKELMAAMARHGMTRFAYEKDGLKIELEQQPQAETPMLHIHAPEALGAAAPRPVELQQTPHLTSAAQLPTDASSPKPIKEAAPAEDDSLKSVDAPIVGTFYAKPAPDQDSFVKIGDDVDENTVVCIIEAMKVMNEVKAGMRGKVVEVCVEDAHPVDYGAPLFKIKPA